MLFTIKVIQSVLCMANNLHENVIDARFTQITLNHVGAAWGIGIQEILKELRVSAFSSKQWTNAQ